MHNPLGGKTLLFGLVGAVIGALAETLVNRLAGAVVIRDGLMWGAVLGITVLSLGNFVRMGQLAVKSDKPWVNFVVGVGLFVLISVIAMGCFYLIVLILGRVLS